LTPGKRGGGAPEAWERVLHLGRWGLWSHLTSMVEGRLTPVMPDVARSCAGMREYPFRVMAGRILAATVKHTIICGRESWR
jgi:hypothetical protein